MNRMTKMKTEFQRMRDAVVSTHPASVLDNIFDKYAEKGFGGQERSIRSYLASTPSSEMSSTAKSYMRTKMFSASKAVRIPSGVVKTAEIPKSEYKLVESNCDATEESRKNNAPPYQKIIEKIVQKGQKKDVVGEAQEIFDKKTEKKDAA